MTVHSEPESIGAPQSGGSGGFRRSAGELLAGGLVGKLTGIGRELALAATFGTSDVTAAFRIAQAASLVPSNLVTSDALSSGFVPLYLKAREEGQDPAIDLYVAVQRVMAALSLFLAVGVCLFAPQIVELMAGGLDPRTVDTAARLLRVMAIGVPFYMVGSGCSYLALAHHMNALVSLRSSVQNVAMVLGVLGAAVTGDWILLAWGFTLGAVVFALVAAYRLDRRAVAPWGIWVRPARGSLRLLRPFGRVVRGLLVIPVAIAVFEILERVVAARISAQTVAATEFANFIIDTCITLLAVPVGLAALAAVGGARDREASATRRAATLIPIALAVAVPLSVTLAVNAELVVSLLYERGTFDAASARATATVLAGFAVGLWCQIIAYVFARMQSAALAVRAVVCATGAGVVAGVVVLCCAVSSGSAVYIGLAGSAYGAVSMAVSAYRLRVVRALLRGVCAGVPGVLVMCALALLCRPGLGTVVDGLVSVGAGCLGWLVYCAVVPPLSNAYAGIGDLLRRRINTTVRTRPTNGR